MAPKSPPRSRHGSGGPGRRPEGIRSSEQKAAPGGPSLNDGRVATEPPYSDQEKDRMLEVCDTLYGPLSAHARKEKIHNGPLVRPAASPPDAERTSWVHNDKQFAPYIVFSKEAPVEAKSSGPMKLWLPKELHEPKKKGVKNSGPKYTYTDKDIKKSHKKLAERPRWDTEHHIMVSQANEEVQSLVREYFDKPIRKEGEGIPRVRELYTMNDRQMGWWDESAPLGQAKHTYLDNCRPWNIGGPRDIQKVSYWRTVMEKAASAPALKTSVTDSRSHLSLCERLADVPAPQATQFWRDWVDQSKKRLPSAPEDPKRAKKKSFRKRGGWPSPSDSQGDEAAQTSTSAAGPITQPLKRGREEWNNRWHVCVSKDNPNLCQGHRQLFTSAQFLSGQEVGHPGAYLGLASQKWRDAAKNVTLSPSGASGRGRFGRSCLLV